MFSNFEESARKVLVSAKEEMMNLNHPYVSSEHLLLAILKKDNDVSTKLKKYKLTYKVFKEEVINVVGIGSKKSEFFLYTPLLKRVIENASIDAKDNNEGIVTINHLFESLLEEGEGVAIRILISMSIDIDELYNDFTYRLTTSKNNKKLLLDELGVDLNKKALSGNLDPVTGRDKEIQRVLEILTRRTKNNPILIGDAGVGKTAIVEELANMIVRGDAPISLKDKRIINLDMGSCVAGTKYRGEFEERVNKILKEIEEDNNIILFIDEIHTLVGAGGAEGAIDASNIFKPALARGTLRCIGATTTDEYKKYILEDSALERRFQKVYIEEPDKKTTIAILNNLKNIYEGYHNVIIDDNVINLIVNLSAKYIHNRHEPDRSIDVLDEVCAKASLKESKNYLKYKDYNKKLKEIIKSKKTAIKNNDFKSASAYKNKEHRVMNEINKLELSLYKKHNKKVTATLVAKVISEKTNVPVYEILNEKKSIIKQTEKILNSKIIGQTEAIKIVSDLAKKIKLGLNDKNYSCLFCGPSGVGKTLLAKTFAENLVGRKNVIKLDMSEYKEPHSISKIVGAPPGYVGYNDNNNILDEIKNKPYSVLILDEIEKAHPDIINLFLQVLDEGKIKDSKSNIVRFDNVVIIMTSNVGFHSINVGFNKENNINTKLDSKFSIPFMNRVDKVVTFKELAKDDIHKIVQLKLKDLKEKYINKIDIKFSGNINDDIVELSNYKEYGARKVSKVIKDKVETQIVEALINEEKTINVKNIGQRV